MPIITLTTDMGTSGYYVGSVKAAILSIYPEATIVDITHHVKPFHVSSAAFIIRNVYHQFPKGTVHIASVDSLNSNNPRFLALSADGHYFVGADNGLFSLALSKQPDKVVEVTLPADAPSATFPARDIFAAVACHLAKGAALETVGADCTNYMRPTAWQPTHDANSITAVVVYIDEYGNCICNLEESLFQYVGKGRNFVIDIKRYVVENISVTYSDGPPGEIVALFSSSGLLELAQNHGNLAELIGIKDGDMIKITFA
ncbi:MAG TPA: SAM-dependent chlorinase/fluorinase [Bacteroidia bacterium]|nr:SAM-dependent chlorinase/fluorinase [Bacteroidia bacterium]